MSTTKAKILVTTAGRRLSRRRRAEIEREHRYAMNTRSTPTDSWLNGYQRDVGDLLAELKRLERAS